MLETLLFSLCLNLNTPENYKYYPACITSVQAAYIQTGLRDNVNFIQKSAEEQVKEQLTKDMSERNKKILGVGLGLYEITQKQQITYNSGKTFLCDNASLFLSYDRSSLALTWIF